MTRDRAARELRQLRAIYFAAPPELRRLLRRWVMDECKAISMTADRYWVEK